MEAKAKEPWTWPEIYDERGTDGAVLRQLKTQLGLDPNEKLGEAAAISDGEIEKSINSAVAEHAKPENSNNGFTKGHGFV